MPRPTNKSELISAAEANYQKLNELIASMSENELNTPFNFENDSNKKEAHWRRDNNLRDILIHLYEWHQLLLNWAAANQNGKHQAFLPVPYTWKTYGKMNIEFFNKHQSTSLQEAKALLKESHKQILFLAETFSNEQLFTKKVFIWTGGSTLGSYFISTTSSHYDWAIKKLKAHKKVCISTNTNI